MNEDSCIHFTNCSHRTVKTLYVWCQGCSHGGHLECLKSWFSQNPECCTGCGHHCVPHINSSNESSSNRRTAMVQHTHNHQFATH